jgi:hypothetical protein
MLTLAGQRARKTWGLLLLTELGMLGAVLLACVVPLYANVTMTASLRATLNAQDSSIAVHTSPQLISASAIARTTQTLSKEASRVLGSDLKPMQFSIQTQALELLTPTSSGALQASGTDISLISEDMQQATAHLKQISGSLPNATDPTLEIAITPATALALHTNIGDMLPVNIDFVDASSTLYQQTLNLRVSGLFIPSNADYYWHGNTFTPSREQGTHYYALLSNAALTNTFDHLSSTAFTHLHFFASSPTVTWYYQFNPSHMTINDLTPLSQGIQQIQLDNANNPALEQDPYLEQTQTVLSVPATLNGLVSRISIIEFPVVSLIVLILGLLLFFLVMMINLLIERQKEAIALLRGRGASRGQILAALTLQGVLLAVIALIAGLLLTPVVVSLLTWQMFAGHDQDSLNILAGGPLQIMQLVGSYALLAAGVALITVVIAVWIAARRDIVSLRRETARSTRRPLWQRLRLDIVAALIALVGYGASRYLLNSNALDNQLYLVLISPLALLQTTFLLLAVLLIIFRFYPNILHLGTKLVERRRGAAPVLALAQIARSPRQPARMTMLLALTSAFAIFALVFTATQAQRVQDVAAYQAGADFSGTIPASISSTENLSQLTGLYAHIPGVLGASLGFNTQAQAGASLNLPVNFQSVDSSTFAQAANWSPQASARPLASLMRLLFSQRNTVHQQEILPAIVDANTWNTLQLSQNALFTLKLPQLGNDRSLALRAVAEVQHIPTSDNSTALGVLVDYPAFANVYAAETGIDLSNETATPNYAWLRTRSDASSLANVRAALATGKLSLSPLYDRRAIETALYVDPIYLTLLGELELGAITALFLALIGCLVASWLSVRSRLLNFVSLRALGATARQVTSTLAWEQGIIYIAALLLGILTGALLAALSLPSLVLTSVLPSQSTGSVNDTNFYAAQFVPPLQVIIPTSLWLVLGILVLLCLLALSMMVLKVARSSIGMILRLSED